ncbi:MAG: T9SS type A sorting domain-containing protein [Melioribacteraceae bacterium]|nr:T9SS type A sorting domain-containing protein [Melioribacteraceae bacterium]
MKRFLLICLILFTGAIFAQEEIINDFDEAPDSNYWAFYQNDNADSNVSYMNFEFVNDNVHDGAAAMQVTYSAHNAETWGGFVKLEHWYYADSNGTYDWSAYDTLSIWYNNTIPASESGRVHFRLNLHDVSDATTGNKTYDVGDVEYWYSFNFILDDAPGWHELKFVLAGVQDTDQSGDDKFHLTGWSGIAGNATLDLDKIKGFSFEISINGSGDGDAVNGQIVFDKMTLKSPSANPLVLFNGAAVPGGVTLGTGGWSDHGVEVTSEEAYTPGTKSIKWTLGSDWSVWDGVNWTLSKIKNLAFRWGVDSLKFKIKTDAGIGPLKLVILDDDTDGDGPDLMFEAGYMIEESMLNYDGTWKVVSIPLRDFSRFDGGWNGSGTTPGEMDSSRVKQVKLLMASAAGAGYTVYLDDVWTGDPEFDVIAPDAPGLVNVAAGDYVNLITWTDVPGESNESYNIFYSFNPITDLTKLDVEVVAIGVGENEQLATHVLRAPLTDQDVTFYYAVTCVDASGNESVIAASDPATLTNTAKGVAVINNGAPANFVADGNLGEWANIMPFRMFPSDGSGTVVTNQVIDGDEDLSVNAYLAADAEYLYFAFDITDDVNSIDTTIATYLTDGADLFIGLYNWHGLSHVAHQRGIEPDYQFRFVSNAIIAANIGDAVIKRPGEDYVFMERFPSGYFIEGRMSFEEISQLANPDDILYTPDLGHRIKIDYSLNDADATGQREGIMTLSPNNEDQSWNNVSRWTYTWIGNSMISDVEDDELTLSFELSQNYPNPFNPTTTINYTVPTNELVTLKVFNILGQEVKTLVNKVQNAGHHTVSFDASTLASGVYIYRLSSGNFVNTKKMMLIK